MTLRHATEADIPDIEHVMRESIALISSRTYDSRQVESSLRYVAHLDRELIGDRSYFVFEKEGRIAGCGGWSRRQRLYAGSGSGERDATFLDPASDPARIRALS